MLVFWFRFCLIMWIPDYGWLSPYFREREREIEIAYPTISHYIPLYPHILVAYILTTFHFTRFFHISIRLFLIFSRFLHIFHSVFSMVFHIFTSVWNVDRWRYGNGEGVLLMSVVLTADLKDWRDWRPVGDLMRSLDSFHQIGYTPRFEQLIFCWPSERPGIITNHNQIIIPIN